MTLVRKIELKDVSKAYQNNPPVIEHLDLKIEKGSFTVLLGPSGCGKSTILRLIAGLEKETQGEIYIDGKSMKGIGPGDRNIAMVFQNYALYPTMTVMENMEFGLKNMKIPKQERKKRILEISEIVGLTEYLNRKPNTLSGGQRQRVALARAIVKKPEVFLMDEPLSNLDAKLRGQIRMDLIELHRKLKTTFVFVTHDQSEAMSMATDIILLEKGRIRQQAAPNDIYHLPENIFSSQFIGSPAMNIIPISKMEACDFNKTPEVFHVGFRPENARILPNNISLDGKNWIIQGEIITREILGAEQLYKVITNFGYLYVKHYDSYLVDYGFVFINIPIEKLHYFNEAGNRISNP